MCLSDSPSKAGGFHSGGFYIGNLDGSVGASIGYSKSKFRLSSTVSLSCKASNISSLFFHL